MVSARGLLRASLGCGIILRGIAGISPAVAAVFRVRCPFSRSPAVFPAVQKRRGRLVDLVDLLVDLVIGSRRTHLQEFYSMPALPSYIPAKDADLSNWMLNFSTLISASPATYGLLSSDATLIAAQKRCVSGCLRPRDEPVDEDCGYGFFQNTAKVTALAVIRPYAQTISLNPGVASSDKTAVGVNPRTSTPSIITPPTSNPILSVQSAANLSLILRYRDSAASPSVKAKPYGVTACRISAMVSATPVTDPTTLPFCVQATKSPLTITRASGDAGKQLYMAAQWVIRTGGVSPWSPIINFTVPAGM